MSDRKFKLPECGMYFGSSVYLGMENYTAGLGKMFTTWIPQNYLPEWYVDRTVDENLGNLVQLWGFGSSSVRAAAWYRGMFKDETPVPDPDWKNLKNIKPEDWPAIKENDHRRGEGLIDFVRYAADRNLYTMFIYTDMNEKYSRQLKDFGDWYIGDDAGEIFCFRFDDQQTGTAAGEKRTLRQLADGFMDRLKAYFAKRRAAGWGYQITTSGSYAIDYEVAAGLDIPLFEDYNDNIASALCRGLTRQFKLPCWGTHMNHEWYAWLPYESPCRCQSFVNGMYQKYMGGSKILVNESGTWYLQSTLCQDSPMLTDLPKIHNPTLANDYKKSVPYLEEARKSYHKIDYDSPHCKWYRKELSAFYDFLKKNPCPAGQPETRIAIVKGNLDLLGYAHSYQAVGSAYDMAEENPNWFAGTPEKSWETIERVFFPRNDIAGKYYNLYESGTPYGPVDIITFAKLPDVDFLSENYDLLLFCGWNTCSEEQYQLLTEYVRRGGKIFLAIPHLSTDDTRKIESFTVNDLVRKGDFSELCGCRIKGKGARFYWAVSESERWNSELEFPYLRRFGIIGKCLGDVEFTDDVEIMLCDDEDFRPLMFRHKFGKGEVYFLNAWAYPGALQDDFGPSAEVHSPGLIGYVYKHLANRCRGTIYITDDKVVPKQECEYIMFSYFPECKRVCIMNSDYFTAHTFYLHLPDEVRQITLQPNEFQQFTL